MQAKSYQKRSALQKLIYFIECGGPDKNEYEELNTVWSNLSVLETNKNNGAIDHHMIARLFSTDFLQQTIRQI